MLLLAFIITFVERQELFQLDEYLNGRVKSGANLLEDCSQYLPSVNPFAQCCVKIPTDETCMSFAILCRDAYHGNCGYCPYPCSMCKEQCDKLCKAVDFDYCPTKLPGWAIALIVIGSLIVVVVIVLCVCMACRDSKSSPDQRAEGQTGVYAAYGQPILGPGGAQYSAPYGSPYGNPMSKGYGSGQGYS
jgi:hypothetical protein